MAQPRRSLKRRRGPQHLVDATFGKRGRRWHPLSYPVAAPVRLPDTPYLSFPRKREPSDFNTFLGPGPALRSGRDDEAGVMRRRFSRGRRKGATSASFFSSSSHPLLS